MTFSDLYLANQDWYDDSCELLVLDAPGDPPIRLSPRVANSLYRFRHVDWFSGNLVSLSIVEEVRK